MDKRVESNMISKEYLFTPAKPFMFFLKKKKDGPWIKVVQNCHNRNITAVNQLYLTFWTDLG